MKNCIMFKARDLPWKWPQPILFLGGLRLSVRRDQESGMAGGSNFAPVIHCILIMGKFAKSARQFCFVYYVLAIESDICFLFVLFEFVHFFFQLEMSMIGRMFQILPACL